MIHRLFKLFIAGALVAFTHSGFTEELLIARSSQDFPEAMSTLQNAISKQGYKISKVQHVDEGLNKSGFSSDTYRVVFFGKADEVRTLSNKFPELIPYIPLNFAIFSEGRDTLVSTLSPSGLKPYYPNPEITVVFDRWEKDLRNILSVIRKTK